MLRRIFHWALRSRATPSFVPQNMFYHFWDLIINLKHHLLLFSHVTYNYRHIITVLANLRVCKSETFFSFCCPWTPGLVKICHWWLLWIGIHQAIFPSSYYNFVLFFFPVTILTADKDRGLPKTKFYLPRKEWHIIFMMSSLTYVLLAVSSSHHMTASSWNRRMNLWLVDCDVWESLWHRFYAGSALLQSVVFLMILYLFPET